jgi:hypothetical protein
MLQTSGISWKTGEIGGLSQKARGYGDIYMLGNRRNRG